MRERKWPITIAFLVLMVVGGFAASVIARRGADDQAQAAADAVQRWYLGHGGGQVRSCNTVRSSDPRSGLYVCRIARGCLQERIFAIGTRDGRIARDAQAAPVEPPRPRRC